MIISTKAIGHIVIWVSTIIALSFLLYANAIFYETAGYVDIFSKVLIVFLLIVYIFSSLLVKQFVNEIKNTRINSDPVSWGDALDKSRLVSSSFKFTCAILGYYITKICIGTMMAGFVFLIFKHINESWRG